MFFLNSLCAGKLATLVRRCGKEDVAAGGCYYPSRSEE